ncbi:MAG TPA: YggS family pyridoxal phosphate-dependent enzyme [Terriglobales bacterium]|nr:YggS family pyridoxal phosphate-dependent enzyme [Terriglobales bacterium]
MSISSSLDAIRSRIAAAARLSGRSPDEIALMAVCKTFPAEAIHEAYAAGQRLFGENRVQEFEAKAKAVADLAGIEVHMIGHLQSNKSRRAVELFQAIDSVDSVKLAERLDAAAREVEKVLPVLLEINVGAEKAKAGLSLDWTEIEPLLANAAQWTNLEIRGLMTVPPFTDDPDGARPYFRQLRELREEIARRNYPRVSMETFSIGMSHDFEVAIEEGSTCVRIGSAIFGARQKA